MEGGTLAYEDNGFGSTYFLDSANVPKEALPSQMTPFPKHPWLDLLYRHDTGYGLWGDPWKSREIRGTLREALSRESGQSATFYARGALRTHPLRP